MPLQSHNAGVPPHSPKFVHVGERSQSGIVNYEDSQHSPQSLVRLTMHALIHTRSSVMLSSMNNVGHEGELREMKREMIVRHCS